MGGHRCAASDAMIKASLGAGFEYVKNGTEMAAVRHALLCVWRLVAILIINWY
jgi:hypothetical protein